MLKGYVSQRVPFLTVLLFAPLSLAQETTVWNCQGTEAVGFVWQSEEGYRWVSIQVRAGDLVLTVAGINSFFNLDSLEIPLVCEEFNMPPSEKFVSCIRNNGLAYDFVVLNPNTGQAALSQMGGAITSNTFYRDRITTKIFQCTK